MINVLALILSAMPLVEYSELPLGAARILKECVADDVYVSANTFSARFLISP